MMESCFNDKTERVGSVVVEDLKKDLLADFSKITTSSSQDSVLLEKEHLQVYLRIRPFTITETDGGESQECITIEPPDTVALKAPRTSVSARLSDKPAAQIEQRFQFSQVFDPDTSQRQMFDGTAKRLVKDVLEGGNSLVFTYGVTNAGKTFTFLGPEADGGILPRSLNVIYSTIEGRIYAQNNIKPHRCVDFTRLTKDQQDEEATHKRNLLRRFKESDSQRSVSSCRSLLDGSSSSDMDGESFCLDGDSHTKFSVWVSFCEIYNENIHDLLDLIPNGSQRRSVLRLSQDIKGNTFVKDLKWIQVNSADEAYKVLKIGRKNQTFSSTKLNNVSSRSHSIFSIRILRIEDVGVPRVQTISELSLCDLAGSERCAKTQNKGERLKEAGNINTSLLTLGKCLNALRLNQTQSKFHQHVPFRESKLTHYLQGFFSGHGKVCMIVNISQCASVYDETLNVLKFSAVAQKVVVLNPKPALVIPKRSAREVSLIINNANRRDLWATRKSSLIGWETSLEDVLEDEDDEEEEEMEQEEEEEEEESCDETMEEEETVLEAGDEQDMCELEQQVVQPKEKLPKEASEKLALESRIREEVTTEFMELFSKMESDYNERLQKEKEIIEDRAERRLDILKNLVNQNASDLDAADCAGDTTTGKMEFLDGLIEAMRDDLTKIKSDAEAAQTCLVDVPDSPGAVCSLRKQLDDLSEELLESQQVLGLKINEIEALQVQSQQSNEQIRETRKNYESQTLKCQELMEICHEKDDMISKLQTALDQNVEEATKDRALIDSIKEEILQLTKNCTCLSSGVQSNRTAALEMEKLLQEMKAKDEHLEELERERRSFDHAVQNLTADLAKRVRACEAALASLEMERKETAKLGSENQALTNEISLLQQTANEMASKLKTAEVEFRSQSERSARLSEELQAAKALAKEREDESDEKSAAAESLAQETGRLRQELVEREQSLAQSRSFRDTVGALRKECEKMAGASLEKSRRVEDLEREVGRSRGRASELEELCGRLRQERDSQRDRAREHLGRYEAARQAADDEVARARKQLADQERQLQAAESRAERAAELEGQLAAGEALVGALEERLEEARSNLRQAEEERKREISKDAEEERKRKRENTQELTKLKEHVKDRLDEINSLSRDLQSKEENISDLKEKLTACNAQIEQLQREIVRLDGEKEALQNKLCDSERMKSEALNSLTSKDQTIHQLKTEQASNAKSEGNLQQYQRACHDLLAKEKVIEDLRLVLKDQELTQTEQEREIEAKLKEVESLSEELMHLKDKCQSMADSKRSHVVNECRPSDLKHEAQQWDETKEGTNEESPAHGEKRLDEELISAGEVEGEEKESQGGEAPEKERRGALQAEVENLSKQLCDKEEHLLQWKREKAILVAALRSQIQKLQESNTEKDTRLKELQGDSTGPTQEAHQVSVLDSSEISTEGGKGRRFPKPEMELRYTPLKPHRVEVRRQGEESSVTVEIRRTAKKRRSAGVEVGSENRKNMRLRGNSKVTVQPTESPTVLSKRACPLTRQDSPASLKSKKDGTLQKIGDFIQSSPTLLGSKAKKIMGMVSTKSPVPPSNTALNGRPKRTKRKLFKTHISSPLDIPSHSIIGIDQDDKESDHLIIKRKLRTRTAKN